MQLWYAPTSPFARKVRIAAHELGLSEEISLVEANPWTSAELRGLNPLAKVPTLVLAGGEVLFESAVICDHLNAAGVGAKLFPSEGRARRDALLLQGLADGTMTAMGRLFADEQRPPAERAEAMMLRFVQARDTALDWLEGRTLADPPTIGEISVAALLGYLDFRWPSRDWRQDRPRLAGWFDTFALRPSMQATAHPVSPGVGVAGS